MSFLLSFSSLRSSLYLLSIPDRLATMPETRGQGERTGIFFGVLVVLVSGTILAYEAAMLGVANVHHLNNVVLFRRVSARARRVGQQIGSACRQFGLMAGGGGAE